MQLQSSQAEKKQRENAFYKFLIQILKNPSTNNNQIYYKKFLKSQFNPFAISEGYPLISIECESSLCYFYVKLSIVCDFQDDFFKFINGQIKQLSCKNCRGNINKESIIYDTALEGLIESKIPKQHLQLIKQALITKNHQILLQKMSGFNEAFNTERLKIISSIKEKNCKQNSIQQKSLKVDSFELINSIHNSIINTLQFAGTIKPSMEMIIPKQNRFQSILAICIARNEELYLHVFKQFKHSKRLIKIGLKFCDQPTLKIAEYYDQTNHIFYLLTSEGNLYKCDLRYMYDFGKGKYSMQKWCSFQNFPSQLHNYANQMVIRSDDLYFFVGKKQKRYIKLFKAKLPFERNNQPIELKIILNDKILNRQGYSVSFIRKNILLPSQCIIIFGGTIQNKQNFKVFDTIALDQPQRHFNPKLFIEQDDFPLVGYIIYPAISICIPYLLVVGGYDQKKKMENASVMMISLKSNQKFMKKDYASPRKCKVQHACYSNSSFIGTNSTTIIIGNYSNNTQAITINRNNKSQMPIIICTKYN